MTEGVEPDFVYNWDNKLRSAKISGSDVINAVKYDPDGNRVYKEIPGDPDPVKRKYIVDIVGRLPVILLVMDAGNNNSVVSSYVYANSQVLAQYDGEQEEENDKHFYLHDRLGSVRLLIDESGDVENVYTYQPYGQLIATETAETTENPFRFTGQWYDDEIDQYYLRARQYDPQISRFTSRDPVEGKFDKPPTLHVYLYCSNDPLNKLDPWGLASVALYDGAESDYGERRWESANDFDYFRPVGSLREAAFLLMLLVKGGVKIDDLYIFDHGPLENERMNNGRQEIGRKGEQLMYDSKEWQNIAASVRYGGTVHLRGCNVARGEGGQEYIMNLAIEGNVRVDAFDSVVVHNNVEFWGIPDYLAVGNLWVADPALASFPDHMVYIEQPDLGWINELPWNRRW